MNYVAMIFLAIAGIVVTIVISTAKSNKNLLLRLESSFGKEPENQDYCIGSIDSYQRHLNTLHHNQNNIDDITWNDLDMDMVFRRINVCCSSVGEQYLYHMLHALHFDTNKLTSREKFISYLKANSDNRLSLQIILAKLGKTNSIGLPGFMSNNNLKQLKFPFLYNILSVIPLICTTIIPFSPSVGTLLVSLAFIVNLFVYLISRKKIYLDLLAWEYFGYMLSCCKKICDMNDDSLKPFIADLESNYNKLKHLGDKIPIASNNSGSDADILTDYIKIMILFDVRSYNKIVKNISQNLICFQNLFACLGEIDASISILSFRESLPFYCFPQFNQENLLTFKEIYHPLISDPVVNDGIIDSSCIITGSNASGKSTFIKAVAINGILSQTINTCTAQKYETRFSLVISSMAVRDDISGGDSYFVAEIKSLKRIFDKVDKIPCLCFIDEILKGTNTIERIAASTAVLQSLGSKNCLCMVASHDIELTEILKNSYANYHFSEQITDSGIFFDYTLKQGPSQTKNAIKLLHFMGFNDEIIETAENYVSNFEENHKW